MKVAKEATLHDNHVCRSNVPSENVSAGSNSSVDKTVATRSNGGGTDAPACAETVGTAGVQPGGGMTWTMLWQRGHSTIVPMADSERTASLA
jgi:hypothetical protein